MQVAQDGFIRHLVIFVDCSYCNPRDWSGSASSFARGAACLWAVSPFSHEVLAQLLGATDDKMEVRSKKLAGLTCVELGAAEHCRRLPGVCSSGSPGSQEIAAAATTMKASKMEIQTVEQACLGLFLECTAWVGPNQPLCFW